MGEAGDNRLAILASEIATGIAAMRRDARSMAEHMLEVGKALSEAKLALPHGAFEGWLTTNFGMSGRTARRYMRLARLGLKTDTVAELGLTGALAPLTALRVPGRHEAVAGWDGNGWRWFLWRGGRDGVWLHLYAFHYDDSLAVATAKPFKRPLIGALLTAAGVDLATIRFERPRPYDIRELETWREEAVGEAPAS
jgi:hypothetical protein